MCTHHNPHSRTDCALADLGLEGWRLVAGADWERPMDELVVEQWDRQDAHITSYLEEGGCGVLLYEDDAECALELHFHGHPSLAVLLAARELLRPVLAPFLGPAEWT